MESCRVLRFLVLFVIFVSQLTKLLAQDFDCKPPFNYRVDTGLYTGYEFTELGYYSYYGDLDKVKELVEAGADIEEGMSDGYTVSGVLHTAAISLNLELFEYILSLDCDLSMIASERGTMPVTTTASLEDEEISYQTTKMLLERGVKPNGAGYLGYEAVNTVYPLLEAAYQGNVKSMELLLDYGADVLFRNVWEADILSKIIKSHDRTDLEPEQRQRQVNSCLGLLSC